MTAERITTVAERIAFLAQLGEANTSEPVVILAVGSATPNVGRPWILTAGESGCWWAWSFRYEGETRGPRPVEHIDLPWTVVHRPDRDVTAEAEARGARSDEAFHRMQATLNLQGEWVTDGTFGGSACPFCHESWEDEPTCVHAQAVYEHDALVRAGALREASRVVDDAAWLTRPANEDSEYWAALDHASEAIDQLYRARNGQALAALDNQDGARGAGAPHE